MKIKKDAPIFCSTEDTWYNLTTGGYLNPDDYLEGDELNKVWDAIDLIQEFLQALEDAELIEEM